MKAYVLTEINKLEYIDVDEPILSEDWVIVKIGASGICSSDISRIFTKGTYHFPTIPGHEFSGRVYKTNINDKKYLGKKVGVFPLIPCGKCEACKKKAYEMCENYDYLGSRRDGGFAEYVKVPTWNLIEMPEFIPYKHIAMMEPLAVDLHAVKIANIKKNSNVAIIGTGMIGLAAAQWATLYCDNVTIISRNHNKDEFLNSFSHFSNTIETDKEYDVVIEAVGSNKSINQSLLMVKSGGTVVLMGNTEGDITLNQNVYWRILRKQIKVFGTWNSSYDGEEKSDWMDVRDGLIKNKISVDRLISHEFNSDKLIDGLKLMKEHKIPYCKVMVIWEEENE